MTGRHRKSLIRLLRGSLERKRRSRQRGRSYGPQMLQQAHHAVEYAVRLIVRSLDFPCAERLQPARLDRARRGLVAMGQALASHRELELSPELLEQLGRISSMVSLPKQVSTVGRMVQRRALGAPRRPATPPGSPPPGCSAYARSAFATPSANAAARPPWLTAAPSQVG